jgi:NADH-quinone oxidoreductase subunit N
MVRQRSVGRLLGYSAIAQAGLGLAAVAATSGAFAATAIFAVTYAVGVTCAFVSLEAVRAAHPEWDGSVEGLGGLARRSPALAFCLAVSMFSLAGVPPLAGFWGKIVVFLALVRSGMAGLAVLAALSAVVAFAGYGSVVRAAYFDDDRDRIGERASAGHVSGILAAAVALALVVAFGVAPVVLGLGRVAEYFGLG